MSTERVGVLLASDLSHALQTDTPHGYSQAGEQFDDTVRARLADYNTSALLTLNDHMQTAAQQVALPSLLVFLGLINRTAYAYEELAYERFFGVGHLTAQMNFFP